MQSENLIKAQIEQTKLIINQVEKLKEYNLPTLTWKQEETSWSILECIEHLNLYNDYYLPKIEKSVRESVTKSEMEFKSGFLGDYFAKSMLPKEKLNKMKTFKSKNPLNSKLDISVLDKFLDDQMKFVELLNKSRKVSLNKVRIEISISSLIKLKLGDTFQFLINHTIRHLHQVSRIEAVMKTA